jgi:hypothetical protein
MKAESSRTLRQVWDMKQKAYDETRHLVTADAYFRHVRGRVPSLRLPKATGKSRAHASGK